VVKGINGSLVGVGVEVEVDVNVMVGVDVEVEVEVEVDVNMMVGVEVMVESDNFPGLHAAVIMVMQNTRDSNKRRFIIISLHRLCLASWQTKNLIGQFAHIS
jgi:hypothetical protein